MTRVQIAKDPSGQLSVAFAYDPLLVTKVKTIPGHPNDDLATETLNSILKQAKLKEVK